MNSYILITGGSEGIGFELAKLFAKDNKNILLAARNVQKLNKAKNKLSIFGVEVKIIDIDLSSVSGCERLIAYINENKLDIEAVVNNAGIGSFGMFSEIEWEIEEKLIEVNIKSLTKLTNYFLPKFIEDKKGGILNIASTAAFSAGPKMAAYYASKAYVLNLTEAIAEEVKGTGVKISCICPGPVRTSFQGKAGIQKTESAKKFLMEPDKVALIAYRNFNKGKVIIIPGVVNKLLVYINKLSPRFISRKIILKTNS